MSEAKEKKSEGSALSAFGGLVMLVVGGWYFFGGGLEQHAEAEMHKIEQNVAADQAKQYEIAKRNGSPMDVCVAAGMVSAAYLQANDEAGYAAAKAAEKADCEKAGLRH